MDYIEAVADMIIQSKKVVVFTGAGFSTESGVPDFRSPGGVWDIFDPDELNYPNFLRREDIREKYWRMHKMMWETIREAKPNAGHYAVAELYKMGKLDCVITQNTDGLHQKAGVPAEAVLELHGTMQWVDCLDCGKRYPRSQAHDKMVAGEKVPRCDSCKGLLKPATIAFGQSMPERETSEASGQVVRLRPFPGGGVVAGGLSRGANAPPGEAERRPAGYHQPDGNPPRPPRGCRYRGKDGPGDVQNRGTGQSQVKISNPTGEKSSPYTYLPGVLQNPLSHQ